MKLSFTDKCRYRGFYWNNHIYYPVLMALFLVIILSSIFVHRYLNDYTFMIFALAYATALGLSVFCIGQLCNECRKEKTFNLPTLGYACFFPVAVFLVHYLLTY